MGLPEAEDPSTPLEAGADRAVMTRIAAPEALRRRRAPVGASARGRGIREAVSLAMRRGICCGAWSAKRCGPSSGVAMACTGCCCGCGWARSAGACTGWGADRGRGSLGDQTASGRRGLQ